MEERAINFRQLINTLYLKAGGLPEILNMSYWDFTSIIKTLSISNARQSGREVAKKGLSSTEKQMIERRKKQR